MSDSALRSTLSLARSETTKLITARPMWILALMTVFGTWLMAWSNASAGLSLEPGDPRLFSAEPIPLDYQGFEMAGFGYVLVVALAALWAGSEYGAGKQIRTTLLATPQRPRVFLVKTLLFTVAVAGIAFLTMWGTIVITHVAGAPASAAGVDPWALTPAIWANLGGVTLAWTLTTLFAYALGVLARSAILPLILVVPLVIGVGDFLAGFWDGAKYLPVAAGAALYSDPATGLHLEPLVGGITQAVWAVALFTAATITFIRRDL